MSNDQAYGRRAADIIRDLDKNKLAAMFKMGALVAEFMADPEWHGGVAKAGQQLSREVWKLGRERSDNWFATCHRFHTRFSASQRKDILKLDLGVQEVIELLKPPDPTSEIIRLKDKTAPRPYRWGHHKPGDGRQLDGVPQVSRNNETLLSCAVNGGETQEEMQNKLEALLSICKRMGLPYQIMVTAAVNRLRQREGM